MTLQEIKSEAKRLKHEQNFEEALPLYEQIWEQEKNEWNGYFFAQCNRKVGKYAEARQLHDHFNKNFPNFTPIKTEKLWLIYNEKIKDWNNENLIEDAEQLISQTDQYDNYTGNIYTKTVIKAVRYLLYENDYRAALEWLTKLDQSIISNTIYSYQGQIYPADRKVYFILFADILIKSNKQIDYIKSCLTSLNFDGLKHTQFNKHIIETITFDDYISRVRLALFIKYFQEEIHLRRENSFKKIYNSKKITLISDLSHFLFCPVSFAINETFEIQANTTWEKDEWLGEKRLLIDRHRTFQKNKSYIDSFSDSEITIDPELKNDFNTVFGSTIIVNNATNPKPMVYSNSANTLRGAPDYILQHSKGYKFALTEKFSGINASDNKTPFESDLVKHYAFLEELKDLNLSFGYFLTWYWQLTDVETASGQVKKKIVISSYRLTKVESNPGNNSKLYRTIDLIKTFKQTKTMEIDGDKISLANKCLNCSVVIYCKHKTGKFNQIDLPYDISKLELTQEPNVSIETPEDIGRENELDDLPF